MRQRHGGIILVTVNLAGQQNGLDSGFVNGRPFSCAILSASACERTGER